MGRVKKKANDWGIHPISGKELREYLKLPVDQELPAHGGEARVLPDGRVLYKLLSTRSAATWPSREAYMEWWRQGEEEVAKSRSAPPPAVALLPPIDDFFRDVEAHAKSLGPRLKIPAEVLDFTPESLDIVDKALKKIPWAKRQVPDLVTPLVAYLGEVMRKGTGGQWAKAPTTRKRQVPVYDQAEMDAFDASWDPEWKAALEAGKKAAAEAKPRDKVRALNAPAIALQERLNPLRPKPIRFELVDEPVHGTENLPIILARGDNLFDPFASVFLPMVEPSRRIPLRSSPGVPYLPPPKPKA